MSGVCGRCTSPPGEVLKFAGGGSWKLLGETELCEFDTVKNVSNLGDTQGEKVEKRKVKSPGANHSAYL